MSSPRPWLVYSLLRLGMFAVVFTVLAVTGVNPILAAVIAAVFGLCVTYIFFRSQRDQVAASFYEWRTSGKRDRDGEAEDDVLDATPKRAENTEATDDRHPSPGGQTGSEGERDR